MNLFEFVVVAAPVAGAISGGRLGGALGAGVGLLVGAAAYGLSIGATALLVRTAPTLARGEERQTPWASCVMVGTLVLVGVAPLLAWHAARVVASHLVGR